MHHPVKLLLVGLGLAFTSGHARAEEPAPVLSLHDLIVGAVNSNLELSARRLDPEIQSNRLDGAWAAFEPTWIAGYSFSSSERAQNYVPNGLSQRFDPVFEEDVSRWQTGITGRLPIGTQYELITGFDRTTNTSIYTPGNSFSTVSARYSPEYISTSTLTITQPLLREFGFSANLAEVRLQKSTLKTAQHDLTATALRVIRDVASAYYEMVFAQENIRVKEEAVAVAEALVRDNQRRLDEGRMAPIDVTQAQSRLSEAREELLLAHNFLAQRRNTLVELTRDEFSFDAAAFTVDPSFIVREAPEINRDLALAALFEHNPTYLSGLELAKAEDIRIAYAKNQRWPRVDLKASFGYNGLNDGPLESYEDYGNRDQPTYSVGVVVNVPLGNRAAKSRVREAENRKRQALLNLKRTEVVLLSAFDTAQRDIANAVERTRLVQDSVKLASAALDAQQRILGSGKTTSYEVAQAQRDLSQIRSRELATLVDLNKSVAQLQFVLGTIAEHLRVDLQTAQ
jgi:outer membrane protein TolC